MRCSRGEKGETSVRSWLYYRALALLGCHFFGQGDCVPTSSAKIRKVRKISGNGRNSGNRLC